MISQFPLDLLYDEHLNFSLVTSTIENLMAMDDPMHVANFLAYTLGIMLMENTAVSVDTLSSLESAYVYYVIFYQM